MYNIHGYPYSGWRYVWVSAHVTSTGEWFWGNGEPVRDVAWNGRAPPRYRDPTAAATLHYSNAGLTDDDGTFSGLSDRLPALCQIIGKC